MRELKKIILIPDSFKGTMTSSEVCDIMHSSIGRYFPKAEILDIPVADGGEGTTDCFLEAFGGEKVYCRVNGPFYNEVEVYYGVLADLNTAVIEMACCAGLPLAELNKNPGITTTYGVGELLCHAALSGNDKIILGVGGSATNDGGCGAAAAAGVMFYDKSGTSFIPNGSTLIDIAGIEKKSHNDIFKNVKITVICDIDNPMFGSNGAATIFAPQKGADAKMVEELDQGLIHLNDVIKRDLGSDYSTLPGGGAGGAFGVGMAAFFDAKLEKGIDVVLSAVNFHDKLDETDLVFTGEGKIDSQSLRGKVVAGVARASQLKKVPVIAVVGDVGDNIDDLYSQGLNAIFSINTAAVDFSIARSRSKENLTFIMENLMKAFLIM